MKLLGHGGIRQLSAHRFEVWQFVEIDGRRCQKTRRVDGGKKDAKDALRKFQAELSERSESTDSFGNYARSWIDWKRASGNYSKKSLEAYECAIRKIDLGDTPMQNITVQQLREALLRATESLSGTSSSYIYTICTMVFNSALRDGLIASNPMERIDRPKKDTQEREALSPTEIDALWTEIEKLPLDGRVMIVAFCLEAGLRVGEAVSLRSEDVGKDTFFVSKSKTKTRTLPMTKRLARLCRRWEKEKEHRGISDSETYCCRPDGSALYDWNLWKWYKREIRPLGAPEHIHDLRHSNLSKMARFMSAYDLQRWAGWSSIKMAERYVHDDFTQLVSAVKASENVG